MCKSSLQSIVQLSFISDAIIIVGDSRREGDREGKLPEGHKACGPHSS